MADNRKYPGTLVVVASVFYVNPIGPAIKRWSYSLTMRVCGWLN